MDIPCRFEDVLAKQERRIKDIAEEFSKYNVRRIYVTGSGNSYYAAISAKYIIEEIVGIPTNHEEAFELANYTIPNLINYKISDYAVIGISLSGATKACIDSLKLAFENKAYTIGITGTTACPMEKWSRTIVIPRALRKDIPVRANTFATVLYTISLLATALRESLIKDSKVIKYKEQLREIPNIAKKILESLEPEIAQIAKKFVTDEDFYYVGGGPNYGTALDGALMVNEMSRARPWAWEVEEMCHGPWTTLRRRSIVVLVAPPGRSYHRITMVAHAIKESINATIISLVRKGSEGEIVKYSDHVIEVPENVDEVLTPIVYDIPLLLFAYYRGVFRGLNPDTHGMDVAGFEKMPRILHPPGWH